MYFIALHIFGPTYYDNLDDELGRWMRKIIENRGTQWYALVEMVYKHQKSCFVTKMIIIFLNRNSLSSNICSSLFCQLAKNGSQFKSGTLHDIMMSLEMCSCS